MKIVKLNNWYDSEGLNIDNNSDKVLFNGSYEECLKELNSIRDNIIKECEKDNRKDITVYEITKKHNYVKFKGTFGGFYRKDMGEIPYSDYFSVYYSSAVSEVYYAIVK